MNLSNLSEFLAKSGMRKVGYGFAALAGIIFLAWKDKIAAANFENCFMFLVGSVMAANYGEHREKAKKKMEVKADAPAPAPAVPA